MGFKKIDPKWHCGELRGLTLILKEIFTRGWISHKELQCPRKRYRGDEIVISVLVGIASNQEEQKWSPDQPMRGGHSKEDQFEPEKADIITTAATTKSKQGQAARIPEAELVNNRIARKGKKELKATDPSPWRS
ncbi:hypothetical protein TNCV_1693561 [Trichonephila clavipes]|nr:hypothetical protein TNCV_1693561 [Trichonephila clavipes]